MKTLYVSWTYLKQIEVPDDFTEDEIEVMLDSIWP